MNSFQLDILKECQARNRGGGLSLPMGSGKTFIALELCRLSMGTKSSKCLIVAAKTLISSWEHEIKKFYPDMVYHVLFSKDLEALPDFTEVKDLEGIILTTPETLAGIYKKRNIESKLVTIRNTTHFFKRPIKPLDTQGVYSVKWNMFIVDEIQGYTNIDSIRCKSLVAISSPKRWGLSGTIFTEPSVNRIFGYTLILGCPGYPRNLPDIEKMIASKNFKGLNGTLVYRESNEAFVCPEINQNIVSNKMSVPEKRTYLVMKNIMSDISDNVKRFKKNGDVGNMRLFSSYRMAMLTYLRQSIICPLVPITSAYIDFMDYKGSSELSRKMLEYSQKYKLADYFKDPASVESSRIKSIMKQLGKFKYEQVVIFTCFRTNLDLISHFITNRPVFTIEGSHSLNTRKGILEEFKKSSNGVLLLTYSLGAEGLNLQFSRTVFLTDFWWNSGKTNQAIARVLRFGQESEIVNVVYFTSDTGIEKIVFDKQDDKKLMIEEIMTGQKNGASVKKIKIEDIIKFINVQDNIDILKKIY